MPFEVKRFSHVGMLNIQWSSCVLLVHQPDWTFYSADISSTRQTARNGNYTQYTDCMWPAQRGEPLLLQLLACDTCHYRESDELYTQWWMKAAGEFYDLFPARQCRFDKDPHTHASYCIFAARRVCGKRKSGRHFSEKFNDFSLVGLVFSPITDIQRPGVVESCKYCSLWYSGRT